MFIPYDADGNETLDADECARTIRAVRVACPDTPGLAPRCRRVLIKPLDADPNEALRHADEMERTVVEAGIALQQVHHADGIASWAVNRRAVARGHGIRTGLEDTPVLPDGRQARDNGELVAAAAAIIARGRLRLTKIDIGQAATTWSAIGSHAEIQTETLPAPLVGSGNQTLNDASYSPSVHDIFSVVVTAHPREPGSLKNERRKQVPVSAGFSYIV